MRFPHEDFAAADKEKALKLGVPINDLYEELQTLLGGYYVIEAKDIAPDSLTKTDSIAEAYWFAHQQSRDGWTHELDLRPAGERW